MTPKREGASHAIPPGSVPEVREVKPSSEQVNWALSLSPAYESKQSCNHDLLQWSDTLTKGRSLVSYPSHPSHEWDVSPLQDYPPRGGLFLHSLYRDLPLDRVWFLASLSWKGYIIYESLSETGFELVFETVWLRYGVFSNPTYRSETFAGSQNTFKLCRTREYVFCYLS